MYTITAVCIHKLYFLHTLLVYMSILGNIHVYIKKKYYFHSKHIDTCIHDCIRTVNCVHRMSIAYKFNLKTYILNYYKVLHQFIRIHVSYISIVDGFIEKINLTH